MRDDIKKATDVLHRGGVILYPTDTIWGIGCDATNEEAVQRIYEIKKRIDAKTMLILTDNPVKIQTFVRDMPEIAWDLIEISDKPLTIVYDGARNLASGLIADDGSIGIRVTTEEFSETLCRQFRKPIVSTSANISGEAVAANFNEISQEIIEAVDYVVEYRQDDYRKSKPSGIIKLSENGTVKIIRE